MTVIVGWVNAKETVAGHLESKQRGTRRIKSQTQRRRAAIIQLDGHTAASQMRTSSLGWSSHEIFPLWRKSSKPRISENLGRKPETNLLAAGWLIEGCLLIIAACSGFVLV